MNLYNCKLNQIVITGDSYGMSPCLVVKEKHYDENFNFDVVSFLDLTTGMIHSSGSRNEYAYDLDHCEVVDSISQEQAEKIKKVWGLA